MKVLFIITVAFISLQVQSQPASVKKVINKYDALYLRKIGQYMSPSSFWDAVRTKDPNVQKLGKAYNKKEKTLIEALDALAVYVNSHKSQDILVNGYDSIVTELVRDLGIEDLDRDNPVKVIMDPSINASMDILEQLRINYGCFEYLTYGELLAVCAHEVAHCVCEHVTIDVWKTAKKQKRNRVWADIGTGLTVGAIAATSVYAGSNGQDVSHFNNIIERSDILCDYSRQYADDATLKYKYRYNRGEESEADIIAYRFLEQFGYGGQNMLSMLQKLMSFYGDTPAGKYNDHPSTSFRIQVIQAMLNGYSGKNRVE